MLAAITRFSVSGERGIGAGKERGKAKVLGFSVDRHPKPHGGKKINKFDMTTTSKSLVVNDWCSYWEALRIFRERSEKIGTWPFLSCLAA
jgi:hypothetical protein